MSSKERLNVPAGYPTLEKAYEKILEKFEEEAAKKKVNSGSPAFDEGILTKIRKTLPKLSLDEEKRGRKKFYSNKSIMNESIQINGRKDTFYN